jgi:hypothetical protein
MKKIVLSLVFLFSFAFFSYSTDTTMFDSYFGKRIETRQWYYGKEIFDAFDVRVFDADNNEIFYSSHRDVVDTFSPYIPNLSSYFPDEFIYIYEIETHGNDQEIMTIFENGEPLYKNISKKTDHGNTMSSLYDIDHPDRMIALYTTELKSDGILYRTWFDPETRDIIACQEYADYFSDCDFIYQYDSKNRIVHEIIFRNGISVRKKRIIYID